MAKVITIPEHTTDVVGANDSVTHKRTVVMLIGAVIENVAQKTSAETFLAHQIRTKIDEVKDNQSSLVLDESEIDFIEGGIKKMRETDRIVGSSWYYLVAALRDAVDEKKYNKLKLAKSE